MQSVIITGFLGAGKTTFLARSLQSGRLGRAALLVNEFGAVDIDGALLADAGAADLSRLPNGCVCCSVQGDFLDAIRRLVERTRSGELAIDRIVLETTGLADPAPLVRHLVADREARSYLDGIRVLTLVDAERGRDALEQHVESVHQVACADVILMTKADLVDRRQLLSVERALVTLNPRAPAFASRNGSFDAAGWSMLLDPAADSWSPGQDARRRALAVQGEGHDHRSHVSARGIESFVVRAASVASRDALQAWSSYLVLRYAEQLLRVKGFVEVEGEVGPILVQGAFDGVAFRRWHGKRGAIGTELVVIARGMHVPELRGALIGALSRLSPDAEVIA